MKKALAIVLVVLMLATLVACGKKEEPASTDTAGSPSAPASVSETPDASTPPPAQGGEVTPPSGDEKYGGVLRIVTTSEGATPLGVPWEIIGIDVSLTPPLSESLLLEAANGDIYPWLAEEYWVDEDTLQVFLRIRQNVYFTDGSLLNADVVVWNFEQWIESAVLNPAVLSAEAVEEYLVMLQLDRWANTLWSGFASHSFGVISKESFEKNGIEWARENPVTTGPFMLKEYIRGERIVYEKNPNYWQEGKPYLDGIEMVFIRDAMTQNLALQSTGNESIDVLGTSSAEQVVMLQDLDVYVLKNAIGPVSLVPSSDNPDSPLAKLEVRQALSYAIDRDAIIAARGFGLMTPAYQYVPVEWEGVHLPDEYNLSYNPEKAKELLAQAGYPDGFSTTVYAMPGLVDKDSVVAVQAMLKAVGINADVQFPDSGGYSDLRFGGWEGILVQHTRSMPAILNSFVLYFEARETTTGMRDFYHSNMLSAWRPYDETFDASQAAGRTPLPDPALLAECHKIVMDNMLCVPMWNIYEFYIVKNNVHDTGYTEWSASTIFTPWDAWIDQ